MRIAKVVRKTILSFNDYGAKPEWLRCMWSGLKRLKILDTEYDRGYWGSYYAYHNRIPYWSAGYDCHEARTLRVSAKASYQ